MTQLDGDFHRRDWLALLESETILTTTPNALQAPVHDRMPVILPPECYAAWLDPATSIAKAVGLLVLYTGSMQQTPVCSRVNNPLHEDAACIEPAGQPVVG